MSYRIESNRAIVNPYLASLGAFSLQVSHHGLAIATAAKSHTVPSGGEIRVVHEPSGQVVFRKVCETPVAETDADL